MKQTALIATLAGVSSAVSTETLSALMQQANFGGFGGQRFDHNNPFGQTSNNDSDIKRDLPEFAAPGRKGEERPFEEAEHIEGEERIPLMVRKAQAAIKDPVIAQQPDVRPLYEDKRDMWEPVDYRRKQFLSPVFLVDKRFTEGKTGDDNQVFKDQFYGGHNRPVSTSQWPIITDRVQKFFGVGADCTCKDRSKPVFAKWPQFNPLSFDHYPHTLGPVYEPQYEQQGYRLPANMYDTMYRGDDYGGHNIPFPHPCPPMPHSFYQMDAFVDLDKFFKNMSQGITDGDIGGYTMEPHGTAGWSADKAYKGDILMRYMPKNEYGNDGYAAVQGYGNEHQQHAAHGQDAYGHQGHQEGYGQQAAHGQDAYGHQAAHGQHADVFGHQGHQEGYGHQDAHAQHQNVFGHQDAHAQHNAYGHQDAHAHQGHQEGYGHQDAHQGHQEGYGHQDAHQGLFGNQQQDIFAQHGQHQVAHGQDAHAAHQGQNIFADNTGNYGESAHQPYANFATDVNVQGAATGFADFKSQAEGGHGNDAHHNNGYQQW